MIFQERKYEVRDNNSISLGVWSRFRIALKLYILSKTLGPAVDSSNEGRPSQCISCYIMQLYEFKYVEIKTHFCCIFMFRITCSGSSVPKMVESPRIKSYLH